MTIAKVDAHHHLWTLDSPHYPILTAPPADRFFGNSAGLKRDFGPEQFLPLADKQNVVRSVYVESHYDPPHEECAAVARVAEAFGFPHAIVGRVDLSASDVVARLDRNMVVNRFRGVRVMANYDDDPRFRSVPHDGLLRESAWRRGYALVGEMGLSAEVMVLPHQLADLAALATAVSITPLVVGHCGLPARRTSAEDDAWRQGMTALARLPHVSVKISGLGMVDHCWTVASISPVVLELIDLFGPERCMFASNFPVDGLHSSYDRLWDAFDEITVALSSDARAAIFRETAMRFYRID
jgi:predicted TIM-barrel fold metal-dependent hydrolase